MICKQCGAQIEDNAVECQFCGLTYEENIVEEAVAEEAITEEAVEASAEAASATDEALGIKEEADIDELMDENEIKRQKQVDRLNEEKQNQIKEIEKRRKAKQLQQKRNRVIIVAVIIAAIAAIGYGSYSIWKANKEKPDIIISTPEPAESTQPVVSPSPTPTLTPEPSQTAEATASEEPSIRPVTPEPQTTTQTTTQSTASTVKQTQKPNIRPVQTERPKQTAAAVVQTAKPVKTQTSVNGVVPATSNVTYGGKEYTSEGGYTDGKFSAALVTGVEVVQNGDKSYMLYKYNGATYYATISASTTTEYVSGRPMTISAYKSSETYEGSPVYEITAITNYSGKNILPKSGFELLTEADVANLSAAELRLARNEIYARHGRSFKDADVRKYFEGCSWYKVKKSYNYANEAANLNSIEKANINFIIKHEK